MKEKNKRSFFQFFARGVTTTHPLCSVFISFFLCFLIVFSSGINSVYAVDIPLPPVSVPINPYSTEGLSENFEVLNDDQKKIVEEILGLNTMTFFGLGYWPLTRGYDSTTTTRQKLEDIGHTFLNTFFDSIMGTPRAMQDLVGSATYKASTYDDYEDYVADTTTVSNGGNSDHYYLEYPWELTVAYKNWFAVHGGVYDWQQFAAAWNTDTGLTWFSPERAGVSGTALQNYYNTVNSYQPNFKVLEFGPSSIYYAGFMWSAPLVSYDLFINTSTHKIGFVNSSGSYDFSINGNLMYCSVFNPYDTYVEQNWEGHFYSTSYNPSNFSSLVDVAQYYLTHYEANSVNSILLYLGNIAGAYTNAWGIVSAENYFSGKVYVGADWSHKDEIYNIDDLGIGQQTSNYIDNVGETMYVDATGVIDDLSEGVTDTNQLVRDNTLVRDNDRAIPYADAIVKAIDKYMSTPTSGVVIVPTLFQNLGKYITYLYEQTKPLVLFTRDLISALTFDGTGMAWVFYGAVSCGLIGGVLCKFLL